MRKLLGISLALVAAVLSAPSTANACRTCDNPSFWDPNCSDSGCTYCLACQICCPGGTYCDLYCGGGALAGAPGVDSSVDAAAAQGTPTATAPFSAGADRSSSLYPASGASFAAWLRAAPDR
jgi:hypothetical protein